MHVPEDVHITVALPGGALMTVSFPADGRVAAFRQMGLFDFDEGRGWIYGHHSAESEEGAALIAACGLLNMPGPPSGPFGPTGAIGPTGSTGGPRGSTGAVGHTGVAGSLVVPSPMSLQGPYVPALFVPKATP